MEFYELIKEYFGLLGFKEDLFFIVNFFLGIFLRMKYMLKDILFNFIL